MRISFNFHGRLRRNGVSISWVIPSRLSQSCTQDHHLLHQRTPLQQFHRSAFSVGPSYRANPNSSLFLTELVPTTLESGDLSELRYRNPCPCTHHASKMVVFLSNSTSVILLIHGTTQSTLASGCNTTLSVNFKPHYLPRTHTLFVRQILLRIMPLGTNYFHFVNGLI